MTAKVAFRGRTNRWILGEAARLTGCAVDRAAFAPRYCELLGEELFEGRAPALPALADPHTGRAVQPRML